MSELIKALQELMGALFHSRAPKDTPSVKPPAAPQVPPWHAAALREVGFHERGTNLGIEHYCDLAECGAPGNPWCAIFVNAMLELVGVHGTRSAMARSFEQSKYFVELDGPAIGAITTMWRQSPGAGLGHVFFYAGENSKGIYALGGNQDDQVCLQYEPRDRIVGYFWPASVALPKVGPVRISTEGRVTSKEV